jgi:hypothetical protein
MEQQVGVLISLECLEEILHHSGHWVVSLDYYLIEVSEKRSVQLVIILMTIHYLII